MPKHKQGDVFRCADRWLATEINLLADTWREQVTEVYGEAPLPEGHKTKVIHEIADALGRTPKAVRVRIAKHGTGHVDPEQPDYMAGPGPKHGVRDRPIEPEQLAMRQAREAAMARASLTRLLLGDPPPGYSALDQKRAEVRS